MKVSYFSGIYIYQNVNSSPLKQAFLDSKASPVANFHFFWGIPKYKRAENSLLIHTGHTIHMHYTTNIFSHNKNHIFLSPDIHLVKEKKKHSTLLKTGIKTSFNPLFLHY